jgi:hypothetical protein
MPEDQVRRLARQVRILQMLVITLVGVIVAGATMQGPDVIRAKGLIIVDDQNRERILLGAPITPEGRKRKDPATGIVLLGENGSDRIVLGYAPGPQIGGQAVKRIADTVGLQINDKDGNERAGFGMVGDDRVVLGLDYATREAVSLFVMPDYAGMLVGGDRDKSHERGGIVIDNKSGDIVMKLANWHSGESLLLMAPAEGNAKCISRDPASGKMVNVFEKIQP